MKTQAFYFIGLAIIFLLTNWVLLLPSSEKQTVEQQDYPPLSLREYVQLHNAITNDKTPNKRILLFSSDGGLGNQMLGAMSALWYAIATDRAFVGEGQKMADLDLFYDTPFDNWLVKSVKDFSNVTSVIRIDSCYKTENALKLIEELKTKYNQVSTLFLQTNCPLMKVMINDPFFTTPLINMGVDISSEKAIYGYLLRAVFKLKPETQRIIDAYEKKWEDYDSVIGIQIRMAGQAAWGSDTEVFLTPDVIPKFWECAESFAPKRGVHYYLTTDNLVALNKTIEHFKGNVEHYESGNIIHFGKNNKASFEDKQRIFVENHLLDLCDDLVISGFSTYGGLSIARSGRKHWHSVSYAGCSENKV